MLIKEGDILEHFKGWKYQVLMIGILNGTLADETGGERAVVVYSPVDEEGVYVRPITEFSEHVERAEYKGPRFRKVEPTS